MNLECTWLNGAEMWGRLTGEKDLYKDDDACKLYS